MLGQHGEKRKPRSHDPRREIRLRVLRPCELADRSFDRNFPGAVCSLALKQEDRWLQITTACGSWCTVSRAPREPSRGLEMTMIKRRSFVFGSAIMGGAAVAVRPEVTRAQPVHATGCRDCLTPYTGNPAQIAQASSEGQAAAVPALAVPSIPFVSVPDVLKLPAQLHLGEASGVHLRRSCQAVAPFERQEAMVHPSLIRKFKNLLCIGVRFGAEERRRDEHPERDCNGFPFSSHWAPSSKFEIIDA